MSDLFRKHIVGFLMTWPINCICLCLCMSIIKCALVDDIKKIKLIFYSFGFILFPILQHQLQNVILVFHSAQHKKRANRHLGPELQCLLKLKGIGLQTLSFISEERDQRNKHFDTTFIKIG